MKEYKIEIIGIDKKDLKTNNSEFGFPRDSYQVCFRISETKPTRILRNESFEKVFGKTEDVFLVGDHVPKENSIIIAPKSQLYTGLHLSKDGNIFFNNAGMFGRHHYRGGMDVWLEFNAGHLAGLTEVWGHWMRIADQFAIRHANGGWPQGHTSTTYFFPDGTEKTYYWQEDPNGRPSGMGGCRGIGRIPEPERILGVSRDDLFSSVKCYYVEGFPLIEQFRRAGLLFELRGNEMVIEQKESLEGRTFHHLREKARKSKDGVRHFYKAKIIQPPELQAIISLLQYVSDNDNAFESLLRDEITRTR